MSKLTPRKKHILIFRYDLIKYPPIINLINILIDLTHDVIYIGYCSDNSTINSLQLKGVSFNQISEDDIESNSFIKFINIILFRHKVKSLIKRISDSNSIIWLLGNQNIWILYELVYRFKSILYLFEFPELVVSLRYRLISPFINYREVIQNGLKVICSEYNRSQITKSYFHLDNLPEILPNKPYFKQDDYLQNKKELIDKLEPYFKRVKGKKMILYQGIFNYPERKLDEYFEAIKLLPEDYILAIMGPEDYRYEKLKKEHESDRVVFFPFIPPPHHLLVTEIAYIGLLTYFSESKSISSTLNTLYCAPNKIFEYSKFKIPMISNDVPALSLSFDKYRAGICVAGTFTAKKIVEAIMEIELKYESFQSGSEEFFRSINLKTIVDRMFQDEN